jgi:hypothetical protein
MDTNIQTMEPETLTPEVLSSKPKAKFTKKHLKIILVLLILGIIIAMIIWLISAFNTYKNATKYQKAYDIAVFELDFCNNPSKWQGKDPVTTVHYCDGLKDKFKDIER